MMPATETSETAKQDWIQGARRLGQLEHSNIPSVYEVGIDESGQPFYTMRKVSGMTLRAVLDEVEKGRTGTVLHFALRRLPGVFHKACDAVAFAHAHGNTHGALDACRFTEI
jgi:serine/threonine protein kinase